MQLPSRQEIRVRNLFNVVDCKLHWQKNGDYLCVKVDRTPKGTQVSGAGSPVLTLPQPSWEPAVVCKVLTGVWFSFVGGVRTHLTLDVVSWCVSQLGLWSHSG